MRRWRFKFVLAASAAAIGTASLGAEPLDAFDKIQAGDTEEDARKAMSESEIGARNVSRWVFDRTDYELYVDFENGRTVSGAGGSGKKADHIKMDLPELPLGLSAEQVTSALGHPIHTCELYDRYIDRHKDVLLLCFAEGRVVKKDVYRWPWPPRLH
ncbi:hypothetical protein [Reyranella sp.]|uniref:hypothetical protein n=1 Tax=Reyranella sp. TaxID=1929291 RepID=UPI0025F29701|nr:hypothetical protein [Reyranella sp.]